MSGFNWDTGDSGGSGGTVDVGDSDDLYDDEPTYDGPDDSVTRDRDDGLGDDSDSGGSWYDDYEPDWNGDGTSGGDLADQIPDYPDPADLVPDYPDPSELIPEYPSVEDVIPQFPDVEDVIPTFPDPADVIPQFPDPEDVIPEFPDPADVIPDFSGFEFPEFPTFDFSAPTGNILPEGFVAGWLDFLAGSTDEAVGREMRKVKLMVGAAVAAVVVLLFVRGRDDA